MPSFISSLEPRPRLPVTVPDRAIQLRDLKPVSLHQTDTGDWELWTFVSNFERTDGQLGGGALESKYASVRFNGDRFFVRTAELPQGPYGDERPLEGGELSAFASGLTDLMLATPEADPQLSQMRNRALALQRLPPPTDDFTQLPAAPPASLNPVTFAPVRPEHFANLSPVSFHQTPTGDWELWTFVSSFDRPATRGDNAMGPLNAKYANIRFDGERFSVSLSDRPEGPYDGERPMERAELKGLVTGLGALTASMPTRDEDLGVLRARAIEALRRLP